MMTAREDTRHAAVASARRPALHAEDGAALVTVIGLTFVAMLLVVAALGAATNNLPSARFHQDNEAAIAAAEAGIDDLVFRLDRDPAYYTRDSDPDNEALDGWKTVPGGEAGGPSYHYTLDTSETASSGFITVRSTGVVNDVPRTLEARIRRRGFLDQIYLTDYEVLDSLAYHAEGSVGAQVYEHHCQRHRDEVWTDSRTFTIRYSGSNYTFGDFGNRTGRIGYWDAHENLRDHGASYGTASNILWANRLYCGEIRFVTRDTLSGPTHSNDGILIDGDPQFLGPVTTNYRYGTAVTSTDDLWLDQNGTSDPFFQDGIEATPSLDLPPANTEILSFALDNGCVYQGPTYIRFHVDGGTPRMNVNSPLTVGAAAGCGPGLNLDPPTNGVIYVEDATVACSSHPLDMDDFGTRTTYDCSAGDAFVWGDVKGQYTVAAQNDVVLVSDILYDGGLLTGTDVLGLVANRFITVHHPVGWDGSSWENLAVRTNPPFRRVNAAAGFDEPNPPTYDDGANTWNDPMIQAALVALEHSFLVENWAYGSPYTGADDELSVRGAIAQKSRGPVGTSSGGNPASGFAKDYQYDDRLENLSPPFFIEPVQAAWVARRFAEVDEPRDCLAGEDPSDEQCLPALP